MTTTAATPEMIKAREALCKQFTDEQIVFGVASLCLTTIRAYAHVKRSRYPGLFEAGICEASAQIVAYPECVEKRADEPAAAAIHIINFFTDVTCINEPWQTAQRYRFETSRHIAAPLLRAMTDPRRVYCGSKVQYHNVFPMFIRLLHNCVHSTSSYKIHPRDVFRASDELRPLAARFVVYSYLVRKSKHSYEKLLRYLALRCMTELAHYEMLDDDHRGKAMCLAILDATLGECCLDNKDVPWVKPKKFAKTTFGEVFMQSLLVKCQHEEFDQMCWDIIMFLHLQLYASQGYGNGEKYGKHLGGPKAAKALLGILAHKTVKNNYNVASQMVEALYTTTIRDVHKTAESAYAAGSASTRTEDDTSASIVNNDGMMILARAAANWGQKNTKMNKVVKNIFRNIKTTCTLPATSKALRHLGVEYIKSVHSALGNRAHTVKARNVVELLAAQVTAHTDRKAAKWAPKKSYEPTKKQGICIFCKKVCPITKQCSMCKSTYCSRECQVTDWKKGNHKQLCKVKQMQKKMLRDKVGGANAKVIEKFHKARSTDAQDFIFKRLKTCWIQASLKGLKLQNTLVLCDMTNLQTSIHTAKELYEEYPELRGYKDTIKANLREESVLMSIVCIVAAHPLAPPPSRRVIVKCIPKAAALLQGPIEYPPDLILVIREMGRGTAMGLNMDEMQERLGKLGIDDFMKEIADRCEEIPKGTKVRLRKMVDDLTHLNDTLGTIMGENDVRSGYPVKCEEDGVTRVIPRFRLKLLQPLE